MRNLAWIVGLLVVGGLGAAEWQPAVVEFKDGTKYEGVVMDEPGKPLRMKRGNMVMTFQRADIVNVALIEQPKENPFAALEVEYPKLAHDEKFRSLVDETMKKYPGIPHAAAWHLNAEIYSLKQANEELLKARALLQDRRDQAHKDATLANQRRVDAEARAGNAAEVAKQALAEKQQAELDAAKVRASSNTEIWVVTAALREPPENLGTTISFPDGTKYPAPGKRKALILVNKITRRQVLLVPKVENDWNLITGGIELVGEIGSHLKEPGGTVLGFWNATQYTEALP